MRQRTGKKLKLAKETLRHLGSRELSEARGGVTELVGTVVPINAIVVTDGCSLSGDTCSQDTCVVDEQAIHFLV